MLTPTNRKMRPALVWAGSKMMMVYLFCLSVYGFAATIPSEVFPENPSLKVADVEALFSLKEGDAIQITMYDSENKSYQLAGKVISHLNPGPGTGSLGILLSIAGTDAKLLISRKILYGKTVYRIMLQDKVAKIWYTANERTGDYYRLVRTSENDIITE